MDKYFLLMMMNRLINLNGISQARQSTKDLSPFSLKFRRCINCKKYRQRSQGILQQSQNRLLCTCNLSKRTFQGFPLLSLNGMRAQQYARLNSSRSLKNRQDKDFKFCTIPGNNSHLLKRALEKRGIWSEVDSQGKATFVWHPSSQTVRFDRLAPYMPMHLVNHFEFHSELTNKIKFIKNLNNYCKTNGLGPFSPLTFEIDLRSEKLPWQMLKFSNNFKRFEGHIWIFKPASLNRGRGIHIIDSLPAFKDMVILHSKALGTDSCTPSKYVIQKYIEKPLLYERRKFDIRVWALVTHDMKGFYYKEGYLRTSSVEYSTDKKDLSKEYIHLTNNAVQKNGEHYSLFEEGNQVSFKDFKKYVGPEKYEKVINGIRELIKHSLKAVIGKLNPNKRQICFEIFGFDFIVDSEYRTWVIECNTNPCLALSSPLLSKIIPEMLDQAVALTVDKFFPSSYAPKENHWEYLVNVHNSLKLA